MEFGFERPGSNKNSTRVLGTKGERVEKVDESFFGDEATRISDEKAVKAEFCAALFSVHRAKKVCVSLWTKNIRPI